MITGNDYNDYKERKTITEKLIAEFGLIRTHNYTDKYGDSFVSYNVGLVDEKNGKKTVVSGTVFGNMFIEGFYDEDKNRFSPASDFGGRIVCEVGQSEQGKNNTSTFCVYRK